MVRMSSSIFSRCGFLCFSFSDYTRRKTKKQYVIITFDKKLKRFLASGDE